MPKNIVGETYSELQVLKSAAGYYIGRTQEGMPYSRESMYFKTKEEAKIRLENLTRNILKALEIN
jgi:hypothetical protein